MFRAFIVACATALLFSASVTAAEIPTISAGGKHTFLSSADKPIHIGDGEGKFNDIPFEHQKRDPLTSQSWKFQTSGTVPSAKVHILMYSLTSGCPTILSINEKEIYNIATGDIVGEGKDTSADVSVNGDMFRNGTNTITITEEKCRGMRGINDSLIKEVIVELR